MKNNITTKALLLLLCSASIFSLYSCESNDGFIVQGTGNLKSNNKTVVELFTNTSCVPCVAANTYLDRVDSLNGVTNNDTNVIIIRFHTTLYANDPFYNFNTEDNGKRQTYYNAANANPKGYLSGVFLGNFNAGTWSNQINIKMSQANTFAVNFTNAYDTTTRNGVLNIQIGQLSGTAISDLVMHIAVVETRLQFAGQNGETTFNNTFRDMITPGDGESISIVPGQTANFVKNYTLMNGINPDNTYIVVYAQSVSTKTVFGAEKKKIK